jgi:integrase
MGGPTYFTADGNFFRFQIRPPTGAHEAFGTTLIRIRLPATTLSYAKKQARFLACVCEEAFRVAAARGSKGGDSASSEQRSKLIARLKAELEDWQQSYDELDAIREQEKVLFNYQIKTQRLRALIAEAELEQERALLIKRLRPQIEEVVEAGGRLIASQKALAQANGDRRSEGVLDERLLALEAKMQALNETVIAAVSRVPQQTAQVQTQELPFLSVAAREFIEYKKTSLRNSSKEPEYFEHRLRVLQDFLTDGGKKPEPRLNEITLPQLNDFSLALRWMPKHHNVKPEWKCLTEYEALCRNREANGLHKGRRVEGLQRVTINNKYIAKIQTFFGWACGRYAFSNPFLQGKIETPKTETPSKPRTPLSVEKLNALLQVCATCDEPAEVWIPLISLVTGARLGELVFMQKKDLEPRNGIWSLNLTNHIVISDDEDVSGEQLEVVRQLKTSNSRRIIALHSILIQLGFVDWVKSLGPTQNNFVFPRLHTAKDPARAASKRFVRVFKSAGIHEPLTDVFHSLRHTYKDLLTDNNVSERTGDKQVGHAPQTVSRKYGSRPLTPKEAKIVANLELFEGLDLSPFDAVRTSIEKHGHLRARPTTLRKPGRKPKAL